MYVFIALFWILYILRGFNNWSAQRKLAIESDYFVKIRIKNITFAVDKIFNK